MKISSEILKYLQENRRRGRSAEANKRIFYRYLLQNFDGEMIKVKMQILTMIPLSGRRVENGGS